MNSSPVHGHCPESSNLTILLQKGVYIEMPDTITVSGFICRLFQITPEVLRKDIRTILLNNCIVDKPEGIELKSGDTLVLSGAMPGLVGAMYRSDSPFRLMRETITLKQTAELRRDSNPTVRVKLLNTVLKKYRDRVVRYGYSDHIEGGT
jgi:hypothetical protein